MSGASIDPSAGPCASNMMRRLTTSSTSSAEIAQVVVHRLGQLFGRERREPGSILAAPGADLGDDDEIVGIGVQRLADQLVGDVRAVVVAGVDVVDAARDGLAQHGQCRVAVLGRAEHAGPGELHGAVAEPLHGAVAELERAGSVDIGHGGFLRVWSHQCTAAALVR